MNYNPIILALDYDSVDDARRMVSQVRDHIGMIKVGLELFTSVGKDALQLSQEFNIPIFLDLKLHDVPTTVSKTVEVVCRMLASYHGEHFLSVHCSGGATMTSEAVRVAQGSNVSIVGITLLTSLADAEVGDIASVRFAREASGYPLEHSISHFVCPPSNVLTMRQRLSSSHILITPGIRAPSEHHDDHQHPQTITQALKNGADWVVIGRPITQASDPVAAAKYFCQQAEEVYDG